MDKILVRGLKVMTIVGIFDWEREHRQPVILDLELVTDIRPAAAGDDISATVDYKAVTDRLYEFVGASRFRLIETLAERCAALILQEFDIPELTLRVSKPEAIAAAETVCIEIHRRRHA